MNLFRRQDGQESIVILDFGSQFTQLIARRIRELGVYSEIVPCDVPWSDIEALKPRGLILSGGPASVYDAGAPSLPGYVLNRGLPVLGICYGMHLLGLALGGQVQATQLREYGPQIVRRQSSDRDDTLLRGLPESFDVWMSHGDVVLEPPPGFTVLGLSDTGQRSSTRRSAAEFSRISFGASVAAPLPGRRHLSFRRPSNGFARQLAMDARFARSAGEWTRPSRPHSSIELSATV